MWGQGRALQFLERPKGSLTFTKKASLTTHLWWRMVKVMLRFLTHHIAFLGMVVQYLARQTRCPKTQRHTPDKTRLQSGQGRILVIRYSLMRIMGLFELEWGWWNLHSWNKWTICSQCSAVEGLVHVDDGSETGSKSWIDKRYYSPRCDRRDLSKTIRSIVSERGQQIRQSGTHCCETLSLTSPPLPSSPTPLPSPYS